MAHNTNRDIQYRANLSTEDTSITPYLEEVNISYSSISADSCSCPSSGPWNIINGDKCTLNTICDIEDEIIRIQNGSSRTTCQ